MARRDPIIISRAVWFDAQWFSCSYQFCWDVFVWFYWFFCNWNGAGWLKWISRRKLKSIDLALNLPKHKVDSLDKLDFSLENKFDLVSEADGNDSQNRWNAFLSSHHYPCLGVSNLLSSLGFESWKLIQLNASFELINLWNQKMLNSTSVLVISFSI